MVQSLLTLITSTTLAFYVLTQEQNLLFLLTYQNQTLASVHT